MDAAAWRLKMQRILEGEEEPGFELLTRIDSILARPNESPGPEEPGADLFA